MWDGKEILPLHRLFETLVDEGVDKVRAQEDSGNKQFLVMIPSTPATENQILSFFQDCRGFNHFHHSVLMKCSPSLSSGGGRQGFQSQGFVYI